MTSCSWLYWCKYHLKLPDKTNDGALKGSIVHLVLECLGKQKRKNANDITLNNIKSMSRDLQNVFRCNMDIQNVVLHILKKLDDIKTLRTFVRTSDGYKVTSDEGFVASSSGSVVKLVNRLEFSRANFTVAKNWVKG